MHKFGTHAIQSSEDDIILLRPWLRLRQHTVKSSSRTARCTAQSKHRVVEVVEEGSAGCVRQTNMPRHTRLKGRSPSLRIKTTAVKLPLPG